MRSRTFIAVVLTFSYSASALDTPPSPQLIQDDLYEDLPAFNLTARVAICSGVKYGNNLQPASCQNAWEKIERSTVRKRYWARRGTERESVDYLVPQRYLSDDGLCAIDLSIPQNMIALGRKWDVATGLQISDKAQTILEQCVRHHHWGGTVNHFSKLLDPNPENNLTCRKIQSGETISRLGSNAFSATLNALTVFVRQYEPTVDCDPRAQQVPDYHSCELALQETPENVI
ncbi:MAG: hypothetical protein Q9226_006962 [Calogaya cf. arnoldii]